VSAINFAKIHKLVSETTHRLQETIRHRQTDRNEWVYNEPPLCMTGGWKSTLPSVTHLLWYRSLANIQLLVLPIHTKTKYTHRYSAHNPLSVASLMDASVDACNSSLANVISTTEWSSHCTVNLCVTSITKQLSVPIVF